jgi:hypothetical protein
VAAGALPGTAVSPPVTGAACAEPSLPCAVPRAGPLPQPAATPVTSAIASAREYSPNTFDVICSPDDFKV